MNKNQREDIKKKIVSIEETVKILKHQESNLLEAIRVHPFDKHEKEVNKWVFEVILGADYIVRLENSLKILKDTLAPRRKDGGKKKD